jgi:hypothetical protein
MKRKVKERMIRKKINKLQIKLKARDRMISSENGNHISKY